MELSTIAFECDDAHELASFYRRLLGWNIGREEPDWVSIVPAAGGVGMSFQTEPGYVRPTWPASPASSR